MQHEAMAVAMILKQWQKVTEKINQQIAQLTPEDLQGQALRGRNNIPWVIAHMGAVNDYTLPILGLGKDLNPELHDYFGPNNHKLELQVTGEDAVQYWKETLAALNKGIEQIQGDAWFARHEAVSAEDFAKEPTRNKLNVLLDRVVHLNHHAGQLAMQLKRRAVPQV